MTTETREPREVSPVEFFGGARGITYAKGAGFQAIPEPTAAELAELEAELGEPTATVPVDLGEVPDPSEPEPKPSPDDPESLAPKGARTPAKN